MRDQAAEVTIAAVAHKVTTAGGVAAIFGGLTANDIAAFGGLLVAVIGVIVQIYFNRKRDRRETELHKARLRELDRGQ